MADKKKDNKERKGAWKWNDKIRLMQKFVKKNENIKSNSKNTK